MSYFLEIFNHLEDYLKDYDFCEQCLNNFKEALVSLDEDEQERITGEVKSRRENDARVQRKILADNKMQDLREKFNTFVESTREDNKGN